MSVTSKINLLPKEIFKAGQKNREDDRAGTVRCLGDSQKKFIPTPPDKGSFPLDHENVCKKLMLQYMSCLRKNNDNNSKCREEAKNYLECRMDNQLMAKEDWSKLGFDSDSAGKSS